MSDAYRALVDKVSAFSASAVERRQADMACRSGCDGCCHVWLSLSHVETEQLRIGLAALSPARRADVVTRGRREQARQASDPDAAPRCAMLEPEGSCAVYLHRPLVCRTQGLALRYPAGFIPESAVRARTSSGEITHCPLNFTHAAPLAADVLDAERVDQMLAVVNHLFTQSQSQSQCQAPETRHSISDIAARADDVDPRRPMSGT